jgi:HD-like signal output (HDOD) protein
MNLSSLAIKVARSENLPVLPQIVSTVLRIADDPNTSAKALERVIERDPAILAKILRVANSAYYGLNHVPSIGRAIGVLGMNTVRSLVLGIAYHQAMSGRTQSQHFSKIDFWRHSLAVAVTARIMGKLKSPAKAEELYGAGMMHDVGILVMDRFCPAELDDAVNFAREQHIPLHEAEQRLYGFDHCDVGALLGEKWGLTPIMTNAIKFHHAVEKDEEHQETTAFIAVANALAHQAGFHNNAVPLKPQLDPLALMVVDLPQEQLEIIANVVAQEVAKAQEAFQIVESPRRVA